MTGISYGKDQFRLDRAYPAFCHSSIDDHPGTGTRNASGIYDGDPTGGINIGFTWNVSSDMSGALNFTVGNSWMTQSPTAVRQSTLTGSIGASGGGMVTVTNGAAFSGFR